jgi:hypothetical protein
VRPRVESVEWAKEGAPLEAIVVAFTEAAVTVAVLGALLEDPDLRSKALAAMRATPVDSATDEG